MKLKLLRTGSIDLDPEKEEDLPARLVALKWGRNQTVSQGDIIVSDATARLLPRNQDKSNRKRVAIDFEHSTVEGSKFYQKPPNTLAGYANVSVVPGEGLVFENIEWLDAGRKHARKDYRELSAAVLTNDAGEVVWCHSLALCRHGQVKDLTLLSATQFEPVSDNQTQHTMDYKQILCY